MPPNDAAFSQLELSQATKLPPVISERDIVLRAQLVWANWWLTVREQACQLRVPIAANR